MFLKITKPKTIKENKKGKKRKEKQIIGKKKKINK